MSILIKGMEMPEFGEKIIVLTSSGYVEDVSGQVIDGVEAIPVPVIAKYHEHERKGELVFTAVEIKQDTIDLISDAPTIIPAEEGE